MSVHQHCCPRQLHDQPCQSCYKNCGCRCYQCATAVSDYERHRQRQIAYGRWRPYADASKARNHVHALMAQGLGWKRVADLAGVPRSTMWKILYGVPSAGRPPSPTIRPSTGRKIMRVHATLDVLADGAHIDATDTRAQLRALREAGWTWRALGDRCGVQGSNLCGVLRRQQVTARLARAVRDLYRAQLVPPTDAVRQPGGHAKAKAEREPHGSPAGDSRNRVTVLDRGVMGR